MRSDKDENDDLVVLELATKMGGFVISNDHYGTIHLTVTFSWLWFVLDDHRYIERFLNVINDRVVQFGFKRITVEELGGTGIM